MLDWSMKPRNLWVTLQNMIKHDRYILRGCIAAQETLPAATTVNPPFELSQWHCALKIAQDWRVRMGKTREARWDDILSQDFSFGIQG